MANYLLEKTSDRVRSPLKLKKRFIVDKIDIIGAGLAGLITAKVFEHSEKNIYEKQMQLPNNHNAILRFKTNCVGKLINKDLKLVTLKKEICNTDDKNCTIRKHNQYSIKVSDEISDRSISDLGNFNTYKRYICDFNLQKYLSKSTTILYHSDYIKDEYSNNCIKISTIPMPVLMKKLGYPRPIKFNYENIYIEIYEIEKCNVYQTIYFPDLETPLYRASITKNKLILECILKGKISSIENSMLYIALNAFGIPIDSVSNKFTATAQKFGKLVPINEQERKEYIGWLTKEHNVYSIGRFATWKNIELDDVVKDALKIKSVIENKGYFL